MSTREELIAACRRHGRRSVDSSAPIRWPTCRSTSWSRPPGRRRSAFCRAVLRRRVPGAGGGAAPSKFALESRSRSRPRPARTPARCRPASTSPTRAARPRFERGVRGRRRAPRWSTGSAGSRGSSTSVTADTWRRRPTASARSSRSRGWRAVRHRGHRPGGDVRERRRVHGAEPLFFLDYLAVERLVPEEVAEIVAGVARGVPPGGLRAAGRRDGRAPRHDGRGAVRPGRLLRGDRPARSRSCRPRSGRGRATR